MNHARPIPLAASHHLIDAVALMRVRSLELRVKMVMEGVRRGLHRSARRGFSVEFAEYRPYTPGDDIRFLDWRLFARTDRDYVKKFQDETNLRCTLVVDTSRSMALATPGHSKSAYAATVAATLAAALLAQGDAVGLIPFSDRVHDSLPARHRPGQLRRLLQRLDQPSDGAATVLPRALDEVARLLRRRGLVVLISDWLAPVDAIGHELAGLRARGHEVIVVQIADPAERDLNWAPHGGGSTRLRDLESGALLDVDAAAARPAYQRARGQHLAALRAACRDLGVAFFEAVTDSPPEAVLVEILSHRSPRRRA